MTDKTSASPTTPDNDPETIAKQRVAKGAAQELIGKLIGDDAEVSKGRAEQRAAKADLGEKTSGDAANGTRKTDERDPGGDAES